MRCLAIRHIACEGLDAFEPVLAERCDIDYIDMPGRDAPPPALEAVADADLVVVLGGPMGVYEADEYPFIKREIELVGERLAVRRPTLGLCLGSQIMAAAAGARVYKGKRHEIGLFPVRLTAQAAADSTLGRLVDSGEDGTVFFHWHGDTFDLPEGARLIGSSERFDRQGFMLGRHGLALQFHPEVTAGGLERWLAIYEDGLKPGWDIMSTDAMREGMTRHGASLKRRGQAMLRAWLDEVLPA